MLLNCGVGGDSWESLDCKEIQPVHPKGDQSWVFIGRTDAEAETPILWPPYVKNWLIGNAPDAGKDWRWEKGKTEDETVGWQPSTTRWTWVWASSGSWWWTAKPGVLRSLGLQSQTWQSYWIELNWAMLLQIITNLVAKNYTNLLSYSYGGQRSGLETKMKVWVGLHPMWRL